MSSGAAARLAPPGQVWAGLATIYLAWGSTYVGMRVVAETLPPLLAASVRFLVAGLLLFAWLLWRHGARSFAVSRREVALLALTGVLVPGLGNGLNALSSRHTPSVMVALLNAIVPLWVVLLRFQGGQRVRRGTLLGVPLGACGVALLLLPGSWPEETTTLGIGLALGAAIVWGTGSYVTSRLALPVAPLHAVGYQMLFGAAAQALFGVALGEPADIHPERFSTSSLLALAYLITVGGALSYSAYGWLLQHAPVSKVATYAFVNPLVAVLLGWALLSEEVTWTTLAGASIVVSAVAATARSERRA